MNYRTSPTPETLQGVVKTLTHVNPENGFFIAKILVNGRDEKTLLGTAPNISLGEIVKATGVWTTSKWGPQFKAAEVQLSVPTMVDGIEKYLASAIEGIGKGYAKKMVQAFGEQVFDVIENEPERLRTVPGIGPKRADSILAAYREQQAIRGIMVFLHTSGLSASRAKRVYDKYGEDAVEKIKANPYLLCRDVWGIGFTTADAVARKQGIAENSEFRVRAGIQHTLVEASGQGSCGLPLAEVRERSAELLGAVEYDLIDRCIELELMAKELVKDTSRGVDCLFLPRIYFQEKAIAEKLLKMAARSPIRPIKELEHSLVAAQVEIGLELELAQTQAVRVALASNVCVITGGPGTGKTTITRTILQILMDEGLTAINLCAPTGKAAKRASEATGHEARTVHRTLGVGPDGGFQFNENRLLDIDALVIDESSMLDVALMFALCSALPLTTRLIIIGDVDQLPSVGPGKVLADIIDSEAIPCVRLRAIFRQAATSHIIKNAHAINRGEMPDLGWREGSDFCFTDISPKNPQSEDDKKKARGDIEKELLRLVRDMYKLGFDPIRDVQVLAPMRKGLLGVESLNVKLQQMLNPRPNKTLELWGVRWCTGDKVMQRRNNYDKNVFNGDVGYIVDIDETRRIVEVDYDGQVTAYKTNELDELTHAYAFTIHKSQGSEFPVMVMPLDMSHYMMLRRNLFYTGVTRAKKLCVVVGQRHAALMAVEKAQNEERYSRLRDWLELGLPKSLRSNELIAA